MTSNYEVVSEVASFDFCRGGNPPIACNTGGYVFQHIFSDRPQRQIVYANKPKTFRTWDKRRPLEQLTKLVQSDQERFGAGHTSCQFLLVGLTFPSSTNQWTSGSVQTLSCGCHLISDITHLVDPPSTVGYRDPHRIINNYTYGHIGRPVRVVKRIPDRTDLAPGPFYGLFDMHDGLCTPLKVVTRDVFFFDEFRDDSLAVEAREEKWVSNVTNVINTICGSRSPTKSALKKARALKSLKKIWQGDSNLGFPKGFDVNTMGINALFAYWKLCATASQANVLDLLFTLEPKFVGVQLRPNSSLTTRIMEDAQRRLLAYLPTEKDIDKGRSNSAESDGNESTSDLISLTDVSRPRAGSMHRSVSTCRSTTQYYNLQVPLSPAVHESYFGGGLGYYSAGSRPADMRYPLIDQDVNGVSGRVTNNGMRWAHNWNEQSDVRQGDLPFLKTEPKIKIESVDDAAPFVLKGEPSTKQPGFTILAEEGEDVDNHGGTSKNGIDIKFQPRDLHRSVRSDNVDDEETTHSKLAKRRRFEKTFADRAEIQDTGAARRFNDLINAEHQDLVRLRALLSDIATPEMLNEMNERFEYSLGNEQERVKGAFGHAFLQVTVHIVNASKARVKALEDMK